MRFGHQLVAPVLAFGLLWNVGCANKTSQLPRQATAPAETIPANLDPEISEATVPVNLPPPAPNLPPPPEPKPQVAKKRKRKTTVSPGGTTAANSGTPTATGTGAPVASGGSNNAIAVAHPPANPAAEAPADTAIAANVSNAQLVQQKQTTSQLLDATEKTLNSLNRTLSHDEEESVAQVRSYVAQSRKATNDGDFERAYNLATKAHLLSDALVKK